MTGVYHAAPPPSLWGTPHGVFPKDRLVENNTMAALWIQRQCNKWYFLQPLTQTDSLQYIIFCSGPRACLCLCMPYPHAVLRLPQLQLPAERELGATSHCPPEPDPGRGQSASSRLLPETALWRLGQRLT